MIAFYVAAVACSAIYTQLMAVITQGTLKYMRDDMFSRMETWPIRYFERNAAAFGNLVAAEYDVSIPAKGYILRGVIDLVRGEGDTVEIVDFKTELPKTISGKIIRNQL